MKFFCDILVITVYHILAALYEETLYRSKKIHFYAHCVRDKAE